MDTTIKRQCGICFKFKKSAKCQKFSRTSMEFLETLLIKLNVGSTENSFICDGCLNKVNNAFNFKCLCISTEDIIIPYLNSENSKKVDLKKVVCDEEQAESYCDDEDLVCRLCKNFVNCSSVVPLTQILNDSIMTKIFDKHIPELNLEATESPVVCENCRSSLMNFGNLIFLLSYFDKEKKSMHDLQTDERHVFYKTDVKEEEIDIEYTPVVWRDGGESDIVKIETLSTKSNDDLNTNVNVEAINQPDNESEINVSMKSDELNDLTIEDVNVQPTVVSNRWSYTDPEKFVKLLRLRLSRSLSSAPFKCYLCVFHTQNSDIYLNHMNYHEEWLIYKCKTCGYTTRKYFDFKDHMLSHKVPFKTYDAKKFGTHIVGHYLRKENNVLESETSSDIVGLTEYNSVEIIHNCELCEFQTLHLDDLKTHIEIHM